MKKFILILILFIYSNSFSQWSRANAGVDGGIIFSIYAVPSTNTVYCGSNGSGVFKSTNSGENWSAANAGISDYGFYPTCFTSVGGTVFMGACYSLSYAGGMYRSTNDGASWQKINSGLNGNAKRINKSISKGSDVYITTDSGVYRSTNNGSNWLHITSSINPVPEADGIFFKGDSLYIGTSQGVYYSSGSFSSWTLANTGLPLEATTSFAYYNGNLYTTIFGDGVFVSSNNGANWVSANYNLTGTLLNLRCVYVFNNSLYVSCNGGIFMLGSNTWNSMSIGLPTDYNYFYWLTSTPGKLITCTYGRAVYISSNNGASWNQKISGLASAYINAAKIVYFNNALYAASKNAGVFKSIDNGMNWFAVNNGNALTCNNLYTFQNNIYSLTDNGVYYSSNGGTDWISSSGGLTGFDLRTYCMLKDGANFYIGTLNGVFKSTDNGQNWIATPYYSSQKTILSLAKVGNTIFAGTKHGNPSLAKSSDNGLTWTGMTFVNFQPEVFDIFVDTNNDIYLGTGHGVHRSTNLGANWTMLNNGLGADPYVSSIARIGTNLFCTQVFGGRGLFRSADNGANWVEVTGLFPIFSDFNHVFNFDNKVFLAVGGGIYYQPQNQLTNIITPSATASSFSLHQNYPNPFNPATTIKYSLPQNQFVKINVYDVSGKLVNELVNGYKLAGEYNVNFNALSLPSGIYFYELQAGEFTDTKKMMLIK